MAAGSTNDSFSLSLKPTPIDSENADPLDQLIMRIVQERGSFRNVTEEALEQEMKAEAEKDAEDENGEEEEEPDQRKTREEIMAAKGEMLQYLGRARNDALLALDFISLLLSKYVPKGADSMSPALKQAVPPATLEFDKWPSAAPGENEKRKEMNVAKGWRVRSLTSAADSLLNAATRLEKEVKRETVYWEQVLAIKEKGWAIRNMPREKHTLGVQFGFAEANPYFRNRGFVPLRMDDEGNILLDPELTQNPKGVRVRVVEDGKTVGVSDLKSYSSLQAVPIEDLIRRARDSLFEEELYHETSLEVRILTSYNVRERDSVIHLPLGDSKDRKVLIDLVPLDEMHPPPDATIFNSTANNIALALRTLLSHAHRGKLRRRSQLPPPMSDVQQQEPVPPIVRPLLAFLHQQTAAHCLRSYLSTATSIFASAGLQAPFTFTHDPALRNLVTLISKLDSRHALESPVEKLVNILMKANSTIASFALPSSTTKALEDRLIILITTQIAPPKYGTEYSLTIPKRLAMHLFPPSSLSAAGTRTFVYRTFPELAAYLDDLIAIDIAHNLLAPAPNVRTNWEAVDGTAQLRLKAPWPLPTMFGIVNKSVGVEFCGSEGEGGKSKRLLVFIASELRNITDKNASVMKEEREAGEGKFLWDGRQGQEGLLEVAAKVLGKKEAVLGR